MNADAAEPGLQADEQLVAKGWLRIGVGMAVAGQAMVFGLAVNVTPADGLGYWVVHGLLILATVGSLVFLGGDLIGSAWRSLGDRRVSIDLLFLVTLFGALTGSLVSTFTRSGGIYYEVVTVLIAVHTVGKMIGARSRLAALSAVDQTRQSFAEVRVRDAARNEVVKSIKEVRETDRVKVAPGGAIAVDGMIESGHSYVAETSMTGEWRPVAKGSGDPVLAGTHTIDGDLLIAPQVGPRRLDAILSEVEKARMAPSALQAQADRLMQWFLPVVVGVSGGTFIVWWGMGPWQDALFNAMAVLLVACPCAMGLATPIAVWSGLAQWAKLGMVARTGDALDVMGRVDRICIDKTGTLSEERMEITEWRTAPTWSEREPWLRGAVAAVEDGLGHPIAQALQAAYQGERPTMNDRRIVPGTGVEAEIDGFAVRVGEWVLHGWEEMEPRGAQKVIYVSVDGVMAATIELGERWRVGMLEALEQLAAQGVKVEVLTGDTHPPRDLPVPVQAGLTAKQKQEKVERWTSAGDTVILVGDGVNDAAAMAVAAGSIAMRGGADLARATATATMIGDDLRVLPRAIELARAVRRRVHGNLRFAACYNVIGMALAATGLLHPVVAAFLMVGSSLAVAVRSLRTSARAPRS
ncbi:MAG: cation-translocating P-type ATPase [Candidatus Synoicihabitans palmerolidicus]|nr:cation-translocating P-type ATPase [Candidatus Synoicihabitans palmerolidicus]